MRVVVLYDGEMTGWTRADVAAVMSNVREVRDVLRRAGHQAALVPVRLHDVRWLGRVQRADLAFNLCEGIGGVARYEDYVVGALELTGVPFTGCRHGAITRCHRKHQANALLQLAGVPVPPFALARAGQPLPDVALPAIVKPDGEDASVGIDGGAVSNSRSGLRKRVALMLGQFREVLVQAYVAGREFNVGFVGGRALPVSEIRFDDLPPGTWPIVSFAAKWSPGSPEDLGTQPECPARIPADLRRRLVATARQAWELLADGEGYGRVDLRLDAEGRAWVLEVNPCPDLSSDAGLARMARATGWDYDRLVMEIVNEALARGSGGALAATAESAARQQTVA